MIATSVEFRAHRCFKKHWTGFNKVAPVNVVIGRNNTGKSQLVDLAGTLCKQPLYQKGVEYLCRGILDNGSLERRFPESTNSGDLQGNHWRDHGIQFVGKTIEWEVNDSGQVTEVRCAELASPFGEGSTQARTLRLKKIAQEALHALSGKEFRRLYADRDIRPESASNVLKLAEDGTGATNIIRRYIVSTSPSLPRELVQTILLKALTTIFGNDGTFMELEIKEHDEEGTGFPAGSWEIYLGESQKGLIPLSKSGSGLKTVILVLLNLLVVPEIEKKPKSSYVFAFEELENNLHPALLRRLFQYIEQYAVDETATILLTTHSSVALDYFGMSPNAQIIHVGHDGASARGRVVSAHFDHLGVISELGAKPSDLLQANGIVWVEGPSDCIYMNKWIDLFSAGSLKEGRDYQCAFYGGSLLARTQFTTPEDAVKELVNLFRVNPNIVVVCDGDRKAPGAHIKDRVRRIKKEVLQIPGGHIWITDAREVENYLPGDAIAAALGSESLRNPSQYEPFFPRKGAPAGDSYLESMLKRKHLDKMDLAIQTAPHLTRQAMELRFDVAAEMQSIIAAIRRWNA